MSKEKNSDQLADLRHSLAHLLAAAVVDIYPDAKPTIGPAISNGFYYDFDFGKESISSDDLPRIEQRMREILPTWSSFHRIPVSTSQARGIFSNNVYKLELIEEIESKGEDITIYYAGPAAEVPTAEDIMNAPEKRESKKTAKNEVHSVELCRGGHADNLAAATDPESFKLEAVAGAYWRGDEKKTMLTRIYGLAFATKGELEKYLQASEEAKARDHRKLGAELDLFVFSDLVGPGLPLFTPKGTTIRRLLSELMRQVGVKHGAEEVDIPHLAKRELYELSGHAQKFSDELFAVESHYDIDFVLKPVNCPHHVQIYNSQPRSYKDLPIHYMQTTMQYRDEKPGQIGGLQRVRAITVDDGHIFATPETIKSVIHDFCEIIKEVHTAVGMYGDHWVSLSLRDVDSPEKYIGEEADWELAENTLRDTAKEAGLEAVPMNGEAALYGPKLDFMYSTVTGTETQLATVQLDFATPKRFNLGYTAEDGSLQTPIMIHRAILGSLERFMVILIEKTAGRFPFWLAPEQVRILTINDGVMSYVDKITEELSTLVLEKPVKYNEVRFTTDIRNESLGKKIREAETAKVPVMLIVGPKDEAAGEVSVRTHAGEKKVPLADLASFLQTQE